MNPEKLIEDVSSRYSEWLEMAGDNSPAILSQILASLLLKEREKTSYYEKVLSFETMMENSGDNT